MLRPNLALATLGAVVATAVAASGANAAAGSYGVAPTKGCLAKKGAAIASDFGSADSVLSGAERARLISATVTGPSFLYVAFGKNLTEAKALRAKISKALAPPPSAGNSVSGDAGNVAWVLVSALGTRPSANMRTFISSCLKAGAVPTGAAALTRTSLSQCIGSRSAGSEQDPRILKIVYGIELPTSMTQHVSIAYITTPKNTHYGASIYTAFGATRAQAIAYRSALLAILGGPFNRQSMGTVGKVAWLVVPAAKTTDAELASIKRVYLSCLS